MISGFAFGCLQRTPAHCFPTEPCRLGQLGNPLVDGRDRISAAYLIAARNDMAALGATIFHCNQYGVEISRDLRCATVEKGPLGSIVIAPASAYMQWTWFLRPCQTKFFCLSDPPQRAGRTETFPDLDVLVSTASDAFRAAVTR